MEYEAQKHFHYGGIPSFNAYPVTRELKKCRYSGYGSAPLTAESPIVRGQD